jgi:hypothetical protein
MPGSTAGAVERVDARAVAAATITGAKEVPDTAAEAAEARAGTSAQHSGVVLADAAGTVALAALHHFLEAIRSTASSWRAPLDTASLNPGP